MAAAAAAAIMVGGAAHAVVIDSTTDVSSTFSWTWGPFISGGETLAATGDLTLTGVAGDTWSFDFDLSNDADAGARITSWGFNTDPDVTAFTITAPAGWTAGSGQGVMSVEYCAFSGPNCAGGGGGGLLAGTSQTFQFSFDTASTTVDLTNFLTRWQSTGLDDQGSEVLPGTPVPPGTPVIPLPAGLPLLIGGLAALGVIKRAKRKAA